MRISCKLSILAVILSQCAASLLLSTFLNGNSSLACEDVHRVPKIEQCLFVRQNCDSMDYHIGVINYLELYYCNSFSSFSVSVIFFSLVFSFVSLGLTASDYLCPNLYSISKFLELSDNLAGLTLLAVGNGSPDVLSTYKALKIGSTGLAISELVGATLFILTVVVGSICIASPFKVPKYHFSRDVVFYATVNILILLSLIAGEFNFVNSAILTLLYVIYVIVAVYSHSWARKNSLKHISDTVIRSHYDEDALLTVDDTMEQSYFDQHSALPTIDFLSAADDENLMDEEFGNYLKAHPHDASELRVPVETGSYGMRVLLRELSKHSVHLPGVQLHGNRQLYATEALADENENENQNLSPTANEELSEPIERVNVNEQEPLLKPQSGLAYLIRQFVPPFAEGDSWFSRLTSILCAPTNILLKLTTPNRESAIEYGEHSAKTTNAFTFQVTEQEDTDIEDFDFEADLLVFRIQLVLGSLLFVFAFFNTFERSWVFSISCMLVACTMSMLIPNKRLKLEKHSLRYRMLNYFGSFLGFFFSLVWISFFATQIIAVIKAIAILLKLSDDILGSTVFALGNSVGDLVSNLTIARMGMPAMAFGACFGGPLLSLCSLGLSSIIVMSEKGESAIHVNLSSTLKLNLATLLLSQVFIIFFLPRNGWMFDRKLGVILIGFWVLSLVFSFLLEILN